MFDLFDRDDTEIITAATKKLSTQIESSELEHVGKLNVRNPQSCNVRLVDRTDGKLHNVNITPADFAPKGWDKVTA